MFRQPYDGCWIWCCTVSLVASEQTEAFVASLTTAYKAQFDLPVAVYVIAAAGAGALPFRGF